MSTEDIAICSICQMAFGSHEEVIGHICTKEDKIKVTQEEIILDPTTNFKTTMNLDYHELFDQLKQEESNLSENNDSDYSPNTKKSKRINAKKGKIKQIIDELKKQKEKPNKDGPEIKPKLETNELQDEKQKNPFCSSNLELSEEFIVFILKQVDSLCENISNGDPDTKRSREVNQNLNNAVGSYRNILDFGKEIFDESEYYDDIGIESENEYGSKDIFHDSKVSEEKVKEQKVPEENKKIGKKIKPINKEDIKDKSNLSGNDSDYNPKMEKIKKSNAQKNKTKQGEIKSFGRPKKTIYDEKFELVKNQCGRHKLSAMALMLNMPKSSLSLKLKAEGIKFTKNVTEFATKCKLCEIKKNTVEIKKDELISFLSFNQEEDKFQCSICNVSTSIRAEMYKHLRSMHRNEVNTKAKEPQNNEDCDVSLCKKLYGVNRSKSWCQKCLKELPKKIKKERQLCPECGKSVPSLKNHLRRMHSKEKFICDICSREYHNFELMQEHKRAVHEKVPCTECGKLIGVKLMKRHIKSVHTPNNLKKFRCDTCGKGFVTNSFLSDHINVHTGAKPYLCKYCPMGFASRGTHAMHEKNHIGRGRIYNK